VSNSGDLLRMLMPAVSPVPTQGTRPAKPPIESRSFDSLLQDARETPGLADTQPASPDGVDPVAPADDAKTVEPSSQTDALAQLNGIDSIQNASLRRLVAEAAGK